MEMSRKHNNDKTPQHETVHGELGSERRGARACAKDSSFDLLKSIESAASMDGHEHSAIFLYTSADALSSAANLEMPSAMPTRHSTARLMM